MHTITFCIYDVCKPSYGPIHKNIPYLNEQIIEQTIQQILEDLYESDADPSGWYVSKRNNQLPNGIESDFIARNLIDEGEYVINEYQKYYSIVYVIDFQEIEVYSKGSLQWEKKRKTINWE